MPVFGATFNDELMGKETRAEELVELDEALTRLKSLSELQATVVEYHFFGGLKHEEIAEACRFPAYRAT
jgi:DNA-directed RNA polymerase specialized sigma24 family protein